MRSFDSRCSSWLEVMAWDLPAKEDCETSRGLQRTTIWKRYTDVRQKMLRPHGELLSSPDYG